MNEQIRDDLVWMPGCNACSGGICEEMQRLMELGMSEKEAAQQMEKQQITKYGMIHYTWVAIRERYRYHTGKKKVKVVDPDKREKPINKPKLTDMMKVEKYCSTASLLLTKIIDRGTDKLNITQDAAALARFKATAPTLLKQMMMLEVPLGQIIHKIMGEIEQDQQMQ